MAKSRHYVKNAGGYGKRSYVKSWSNSDKYNCYYHEAKRMLINHPDAGKLATAKQVGYLVCLGVKFDNAIKMERGIASAEIEKRSKKKRDK